MPTYLPNRAHYEAAPLLLQKRFLYYDIYAYY